MKSAQARWILAFDASCGKCREIARIVAQARERKLEVLPLTHSDVKRWRAQSLSFPAPWAPTLIKVEGEIVQSWTGRAIAIPLARRLGPRSTLRVVRALGQLRDPDHPIAASGDSTSLKSFLRLVAGVAVVTVVLATNQLPGFAESGSSKARAWVAANRNRLPQTYDDIVGYSMAYRRAIYTELSPTVRSQLWVEQLNRYRIEHPQLSADQATAIDRAVTILASESTFAVEPADRSDLDQKIEEHKELAIGAFGRDEAHDLFATLGPADDTVKPQQGDCVCHHRDDWWCPTGQVCNQTHECRFEGDGCGWWNAQPCDGLCFS